MSDKNMFELEYDDIPVVVTSNTRIIGQYPGEQTWDEDEKTIKYTLVLDENDILEALWNDIKIYNLEDLSEDDDEALQEIEHNLQKYFDKYSSKLKELFRHRAEQEAQDRASNHYVNESFDDYVTYERVARKSVEDSDGFLTDYTWYKGSDGNNVFVLGDSDIYGPEDGDWDWEEENDEAAQEWFDDYTGFSEELYETTDLGVKRTHDNMARLYDRELKGDSSDLVMDYYVKSYVIPKFDGKYIVKDPYGPSQVEVQFDIDHKLGEHKFTVDGVEHITRYDKEAGKIIDDAVHAKRVKTFDVDIYEELTENNGCNDTCSNCSNDEHENNKEDNEMKVLKKESNVINRGLTESFHFDTGNESALKEIGSNIVKWHIDTNGNAGMFGVPRAASYSTEYIVSVEYLPYDDSIRIYGYDYEVTEEGAKLRDSYSDIIIKGYCNSPEELEPYFGSKFVADFSKLVEEARSKRSSKNAASQRQLSRLMKPAKGVYTIYICNNEVGRDRSAGTKNTFEVVEDTYESLYDVFSAAVDMIDYNGVTVQDGDNPLDILRNVDVTAGEPIVYGIRDESGKLVFSLGDFRYWEDQRIHSRDIKESFNKNISVEEKLKLHRQVYRAVFEALDKTLR